MTSGAGLNWSGTYRYRAELVHRPSSIDELRRLVTTRERLRAVGTRHSFNDVGDSAELVSTADLPGAPELDAANRRVRVPGGLRYGDLALFLQDRGWALANLASLPHISVAGSVATATHGSGNANRSLASAVTSMRVLTSDGNEVFLSTPEDLAGAVVHLGALGIVTELELVIEPTYRVRQDVYLDLPWDVLDRDVGPVLGAGYSVSVMTNFAGPSAGMLWVKSKLEPGSDGSMPGELFGAPAATIPLHPTRGNDPVHCTPQLGLPGAWCDRLPHFLRQFTPSSGAEIQSEYLFDRALAAQVIAALRGLGDRIAALVRSAEIRSVASDDLWLSPAHRRDSAAVHFTWRPEAAAVEALVIDIEAALADFDVRPHWAKVFHAPSRPWPELYPRLPDFAQLVRTYDPRGVFRNAFLDRLLLDQT